MKAGGPEGFKTPTKHDATFKVMDLDDLAHVSGEEQGGDVCTLNHLLGTCSAINLNSAAAG